MADSPQGYAEIAVNAAVQGTFHYHIPPGLLADLVAGHLVRVSFGRHIVPGIVVARHTSAEVEQTKPILGLLDPHPVLTPAHIAWARWMASAYLVPLSAALWLFLPPGSTGTRQIRIHLVDASAEPANPRQAAIVAHLRAQGPQTKRQLQNHLEGHLDAALRALDEAGIIERIPTLGEPTVRPRTVRMVRLLDSAPDLTPKQVRIVQALHTAGGWLDAPELGHLSGATSADLRRLADRHIVAIERRQIVRESLDERDDPPAPLMTLTHEQMTAWQPIQAAVQARRAGAFLLHGVTGSGKTEIYLHAIAQTIAQGRQAIFLVPEIALTPQTIRRVAQRFPRRIAIVHGGLSPGERYDTWDRARKGQLDVIVGTRSGLFTPLPDIGLIILDEEHDTSYKHTPPFNAPYYHARDVAEHWAHLNQAVVILGSATPDVETRYRADQNTLHYLRLERRIMGHGPVTSGQPASLARNIDLPPVQVIDMRAELRAGHTHMFSRALQTALGAVLAQGQQAMLLLNRRGQASYVFCRDCGYAVQCERCDTSMTYHRQGEAMRCHHCGHQQSVPTACPQCGSARIRFFGAGTQQVEDALAQLFPQARILRWDADTVTRPEQHSEILGRFIQGEADIVVGTQMIAKGLDLPLVTLVGVVSADPGLALPDFRATERGFQLLAQVAGRAGRGALGGQVILQTYKPDNLAIQYAAQHDYVGFYAQELVARRDLGYPPFRQLARVLVQQSHPVHAERAAQEVADRLRRLIAQENHTDTSLIGPAPCYFSRIDKQYRWQVLVRGPDVRTVVANLALVAGSHLELDPLDLL